jgi:hypothetical protein
MAKPLPDPRQAASFHFINYEFDPASGTLQLHYRFDTGPLLTETLVFPYQPWPQEPGRQQALSRAFELLHLVAGISYYKAGIPSQLISPPPGRNFLRSSGPGIAAPGPAGHGRRQRLTRER